MINMLTKEEMQKWFESRYNVYSFLSNVYGKEIAKALFFLQKTPIITLLADIIHIQSLQESSHDVKRELDQHKGDNSYVEKLSEEYNRLFLGPGHLEAPPWESVYTTKERILFGEPTFKVKKIYQSFGLNISTSQNEPEDHITFELAFMAKLCELYLGNKIEKDVILQGQYQFLKEHLLQWVPQWAQDITIHAETEFWRYLGVMTSCWLEDDFKKIEDMLIRSTKNMGLPQ